jgi:hypothetical protein
MSLVKRRIRNYLTPDFMAMEFRYGTLTEGIRLEIILSRTTSTEGYIGPVYFCATKPGETPIPAPESWESKRPNFAEVWKVLQENWKKIQEEKKNGN